MMTAGNGVRVLIMCAIAALSSGCGTIISGTSQNISITTVPPGAQVQIKEQSATTPATMSVSRRMTTTAVITKPGYEPRTVDLSCEINPVFWLDIPCGAIILSPLYMAIDGATGGANRLTPSIIEETLTALPSGVNRHSRVSNIDPKPALPRQGLSGSPSDPKKCRICVICDVKYKRVFMQVKDGDDTVGYLGRNSFMVWERDPGAITLRSIRLDQERSVELTTQAGRTYYVRQDVRGFAAAPVLEIMDEAAAQNALQECEPIQASDYVIY